VGNGTYEIPMRFLRNVKTSVGNDWGRAIAQAVVAGFSPRRPGFDPESGQVGCGGQSGAGAGFLRVLRFPLPIFILPNSPSS
jgi:hypothetical protein